MTLVGVGERPEVRYRARSKWELLKPETQDPDQHDPFARHCHCHCRDRRLGWISPRSRVVSSQRSQMLDFVIHLVHRSDGFGLRARASPGSRAGRDRSCDTAHMFCVLPAGWKIGAAISPMPTRLAGPFVDSGGVGGRRRTALWARSPHDIPESAKSRKNTSK